MTDTRHAILALLCWCYAVLLCVPAAHAAARVNNDESWKALTLWQDLPPLYTKAPFPTTLSGKTLALVWNGKHNSDHLLRRFGEYLQRAAPGIRFVPSGRPVFFSPISHDMAEAEKSASQIRALHPELVVFATGDCRSCAAWMAVEAVLLEKAGIATVALVTQPFYKTYLNVCRNMRMELLTCLAVPHPVAVISTEKVDAKAQLFFEEFLKLFPTEPMPSRPCMAPSAATGE